MISIGHALMLLAASFIAFVMWRAIRPQVTAASADPADAAPTDPPPSASRPSGATTAIARRDRTARPPDAECEACGAPRPRFAPPTIVEVRSMIDLSFLDDFLLRAGFRRAMRHAVSVHRDLDVSETLCEGCHRVARMVCESKVAAIDAARAAASRAEAADVARFTDFGLLAEVRKEVREQRERRSNAAVAP